MVPFLIAGHDNVKLLSTTVVSVCIGTKGVGLYYSTYKTLQGALMKTVTLYFIVLINLSTS